MKVALALLTKDKPELTKRSIEPLLQPDKFDLCLVDGSENERPVYPPARTFTDIRGGADAAIVFALTCMLGNDQIQTHYDYVGIIEQDVLLDPNWFASTFQLFLRGEDEGLRVGAVSARSYEDRILVQRDGYALMHNLGAGQTIFTREAARLILDNYRTGWTTENRLIFSQLSGIDIGRYWAFRGNEHATTADWHFDAILARNGLASLAPTPNLATMLDQDIEEQGLKYADGKTDLLRNDEAFNRFEEFTRAIRAGERILPFNNIQYSNGMYHYFPHQIEGLGGKFSGEWKLRWSQGFGPFAYEAVEPFVGKDVALGSTFQSNIPSTIEVPVLGTCEFLISGGQNGGKVAIEDLASGYKCNPELAPEGEDRKVMTLPVPGGCIHRTVRLTCLTPGGTFYGLRTVYPQAWNAGYSFGWSRLPRCRD